jgi:3-oxoacyl-[acyl-carrier protein] reductase
LEKSDVLINNAAIAFDGLLATQGEQFITDIIQVNLVSTLLLTKKYIRERLRVKQTGVIVNVSSIIAIRGYAGLASYAATKSGLDGMTRSLSRELGHKGFRVNSVLPGYMETDMSKALNEREKNQIIRRTPLGRLANTDDINSVIEFLISDASKFITGQSIVVDGGITV